MKTSLKLDVNAFNCSIVEQCRFSVRNEAVERYRSALENAGNKWIFPPLQVWQDGETNYLLDGHHRLLAVRQIKGIQFVPVVKHDFTNASEAKRFALHVNCTHGERLTREETRANIRAFMLEGGALESDTAIANLFGVSRVLVSDIRHNKDGMTKKEKAEADVAKVLAENPSATITEIAEKANLSRATAKQVAKRLTDTPAKPLPVGVMVDCNGHEIPQNNIDKLVRIKSALKQCSTALKDVESSLERLNDVGGFAQTSELETINNAVKQIRSVLKYRKPDAVCTCRGDGCRKCGGVGFLEKSMFDVIIPEYDK